MLGCSDRARFRARRMARLALVVATFCPSGPACRREESRRGQARRELRDVSGEAGIRFVHENGARGRRHMPETVIGGAGWIDYDQDGLLDLYLVNGNIHSARGGEGKETDALYRNTGKGTFEDVTAARGISGRGYGCGLAVGDYDGSGFPDIYVTQLGPNVLYRNEDGRSFLDVTAGSGTAAGGWSTSAAFLDHDGDGDLDLWVCRYVDYDPEHVCREGPHTTYCSPHEFPGVPDVLYRNEGDGTFTDVAKEAGIAIAGPSEGKSLGILTIDFDDDGDTDVFIACDQVPNLIFRNEGDGRFREVGLLANIAYPDDGRARAGMGVDGGDVDLDGRQDIVVTNFSDEPNTLFRNEGGFFSDVTKRLNIGGPTLEDLGFGVLLADLDLDSDLDLFFANGHVQDNVAVLRPGRRFEQKAQLLENLDGARFVDASARWGSWFGRAVVGRAAACGDYDEDGDEDIAVLVNGGKAVLLGNDGPPSHWIALRLEGRASNRDGYGARVRIEAETPRGIIRRSFECRSARSYSAACDPRVRAGLGAGPVAIRKVEVLWPSGVEQVLRALEIDRVHRVVEPEGAAR